jgi:predicted Rossmann-fold nucleotide-binding protein
VRSTSVTRLVGGVIRVLVCGGRTYSNVHRVHSVIQALPHDAVIITGGANGADTLAEHSALSLGMVAEVYYPNWDKYGKAAGPIRNQEMLDSGIDKVIAFPGGYGTADMIRRARKADIPVEEIEDG